MLTGPVELIAELTHRCPLGCPYCCNPLALEPRERELDVATWSRVFNEAAALGVSQVELSGGEPGMRRDLVDIAANARETGLAVSLVTSGVGIDTRTLRDLWEAGLERIQVSFQDADAVSADHIAHKRGAFQQKYALAAEAVRLGMTLTINVVMHRGTVGHLAAMVELARGLKAGRIEIVELRVQGWAVENRGALALAADQSSRARAELDELRRQHGNAIEIICVPADGRERALRITPSGEVFPYRMTEAVLEAEAWSVRDRSLADICANAPALSRWRDGSRPDAAPLSQTIGVEADKEAAGYTYRWM